MSTTSLRTLAVSLDGYELLFTYAQCVHWLIALKVSQQTPARSSQNGKQLHARPVPLRSPSAREGAVGHHHSERQDLSGGGYRSHEKPDTSTHAEGAWGRSKSAEACGVKFGSEQPSALL
jgi:hypothetical protein